MQNCILDTSTLQSLYRAQVLRMLPNLFNKITISHYIADETAWSLLLYGSHLVPILSEFEFIQVTQVGELNLRETIKKVGQFRFCSNKHQNVDLKIAIHDGKYIAWTNKRHVQKVKIADLSVIALADNNNSNVAIIDDIKTTKICEMVGINVMTTREVLQLLLDKQLISDLDEVLVKIISTGYHPTKR